MILAQTLFGNEESLGSLGRARLRRAERMSRQPARLDRVSPYQESANQPGGLASRPCPSAIISKLFERTCLRNSVSRRGNWSCQDNCIPKQSLGTRSCCAAAERLLRSEVVDFDQTRCQCRCSSPPATRCRDPVARWRRCQPRVDSSGPGRPKSTQRLVPSYPANRYSPAGASHSHCAARELDC